MKDKFNLAVKLFTNKSIEKSFQIISELYYKSFETFNKGLISEEFFNSIISFYLVEIGTGLSEESLSISNRKHIETIIENDEILTLLRQVYDEIPFQIWFNYYLLLVTNQKLIKNEDNFLAKVWNLYSSIDSTSQDPYLKDFVDLYVLEILPRFGKYEEAESIIQKNSLYSGSEIETLNEIKQKQAEAEKQAKQIEKDKNALEKEAKKREIQKQKDLDAQLNLNLKARREAEKLYTNEIIPKSPKTDQLQVLRAKLGFLYNLSKSFIKENSPLILVVVLLFFSVSRFVNVKRIDVRKKLVDTVKMAFKITYL
jgi:hypothetical protein